ncbi:MAG: F0F1 ATP synthase subunit gamma [Gammaproteobacteria bacterium]
MSKTQEIRSKIVSIGKTKKITNAMQMVAAGKRRKTEMRMQASLPYAEKIRRVVEHVANSDTEYRHNPYLTIPKNPKSVGLILISTDRGLCGGLNINLFKKVLLSAKEWQKQGISTSLFLIGSKASAFFKNVDMPILAQVKNLGDRPNMSDLIGLMQVGHNAYINREIDLLYIAYNEFVNTMVQQPVVKQLFPVSSLPKGEKKHHWDYIYEPNSFSVLQSLLKRYVETQVYQALVDNIACEQAARMVAMKNATDNANKFIADLGLAYNKARQAMITQEITEIVGGAAAV